MVKGHFELVVVFLDSDVTQSHKMDCFSDSRAVSVSLNAFHFLC